MILNFIASLEGEDQVLKKFKSFQFLENELAKNWERSKDKECNKNSSQYALA